ncbi:MAG: hypothetical protein ACK5PS_12440 [Desulfopila sp.]
MNEKTHFRSTLPIVALTLFVLLLIGGCSTGQPYSATGNSQISSVDVDPFNRQVGDFADIEIPMDMKYERDESVQIRTSSFEGGILTYRGRVELNSLKTYITSAMENKQWKLVGEAQTQKTLLAFSKPNKTCMIVLEEGFGGKYGFTTAYLYITVDVAASGQLNPFGEPTNN